MSPPETNSRINCAAWTAAFCSPCISRRDATCAGSTITDSTPVATALTFLGRVLEEETRDQFAAAQKDALAIQKRYSIEDAVYKPKIHSLINDDGVTLSLFYVSHYREFSATRNRINRRLIAELETHPESRSPKRPCT